VPRNPELPRELRSDLVVLPMSALMGPCGSLKPAAYASSQPTGTSPPSLPYVVHLPPSPALGEEEAVANE